MAIQKYRLQTVQDVRERAKRDAARVVAARRAELAEREAELARCIRAVEECRAQQHGAQAAMIEQLARGSEAHNVVAYRTHLADLREREETLKTAVVGARAGVARAEAELERATMRLVEAAREVQVIEKHRDTWERGRRSEESRREGKLNDEIGAIIHGRRTP